MRATTTLHSVIWFWHCEMVFSVLRIRETMSTFFPPVHTTVLQWNYSHSNKFIMIPEQERMKKQTLGRSVNRKENCTTDKMGIILWSWLCQQLSKCKCKYFKPQLKALLFCIVSIGLKLMSLAENLMAERRDLVHLYISAISHISMIISETEFKWKTILFWYKMAHEIFHSVKLTESRYYFTAGQRLYALWLAEHFEHVEKCDALFSLFRCYMYCGLIIAFHHTVGFLFHSHLAKAFNLLTFLPLFRRGVYFSVVCSKVAQAPE